MNTNMKYFQSGTLCVWFVLLKNIMCTDKLNVINKSLKREDMPVSLSASLNEYSVAEILDFFDEHHKKIQYTKKKDFVLVLGDEDTEKRTLALLLAAADLKLTETSNQEFVYADRYDVINKLSQSITPELIIDEKSGLEYNIVSGWNQSTDIQHELTLYSTQQILKFSKTIKIIFVINARWFPSIDAFDTSRLYLREFVTNATIWMTNINSILNGFSLVVTDVENVKLQMGNCSIFKNDSDLIISIATDLNEVRNEFRIENESNETSADQKELNYKKMTLIENLTKKIVRFYRIGILRKANQTGIAYDIPYIEEERKTISRNLHDFTRYIDTVQFNFPISDEMSKQIPKLLVELRNRLAADVSEIASDIKDFFLNEEKLYSDLRILFEIMNNGYMHLSQVNSTQLKEFGKQLLNIVDLLKINMITDHFINYFDHIEQYDYFFERSVANRMSHVLNTPRMLPSLNIFSSFERTKAYMGESNTWYAFLIQLHAILSEYRIQKDIKQYSEEVAKLMVQFSIEEYEEKNIDDTYLEKFLDHIDTDIYNQVKNMTVNIYKLNAIKEVLDQTMNSHNKYQCSNEKLIIFGYFVWISQVVDIECMKQAKLIEIYAMNTVFVDTDIDKTGKNAQIIIVATTWFVDGYRKIILNGVAGEAHDSNEIDSFSVSVNGKPGKPGGSAGNFIGIGNKFYTEDQLEIHVNGGNGGPGQNGGKGKNPLKNFHALIII